MSGQGSKRKRPAIETGTEKPEKPVRQAKLLRTVNRTGPVKQADGLEQKSFTGQTERPKRAEQDNFMKNLKSGRRFDKKHISYGICAVGLVFVVVTAFLVPQFVFAVQDQYRTRNTQVKERGDLDVTKLNLKYERLLKVRMKNFAEVSKYFVTAVDYEISDTAELQSVLDGIMYDDGFYILYNWETFSEEILGETIATEDVKVWKKYIIYSGDIEEGIALIVWYLDFYIGDNKRVRIVKDAETGTFYYCKITLEPENQVEHRKLVEMETSENIAFETTASNWYVFDKEAMIYYRLYYEANLEKTSNLSVSEGSTYESDYNGKNYINFTFRLDYKEASLDFILKVADSVVDPKNPDTDAFKQVFPDVEIGILQIGELIPEMVQE